MFFELSSDVSKVADYKNTLAAGTDNETHGWLIGMSTVGTHRSPLSVPIEQACSSSWFSSGTYPHAHVQRSSLLCRFSVSSSTAALSISESQFSDAGFYHCRVQLPGLFNDPASTVHLIIIRPHLRHDDVEKFNTAHMITGWITEQKGSDVTGGASTEPMVALVQSHVQEKPVILLQTFVGSTLRLAFIIFIPAVLLAAAYRVWRSNQRAETDRRSDQSEEEENSSM
ncbi:hypothetical protein AMECASPLE_031454 [Ameca splendens]|uniref:Ig-like domain-containing protein n=1 Tax=Ameca splendens TaxID=208324 RepID=A0ABV0YHR0_9TELE